jgi:hypothetical protein
VCVCDVYACSFDQGVWLKWVEVCLLRFVGWIRSSSFADLSDFSKVGSPGAVDLGYYVP